MCSRWLLLFVVIGEGFDQIDGTILERNKIMYSLSRYDKNSTCESTHYCTPGYMGKVYNEGNAKQ